jgi:hypothetical protein
MFMSRWLCWEKPSMTAGLQGVPGVPDVASVPLRRQPGDLKPWHQWSHRQEP